ncbi:unnamed product [Ostreococcus tauri]|uniref:Unnamed product n=1 Tax=Ostreococcus tauri TaxID=70448 RepID=A0A090MD44_OSTTA|nr:unnamed product [Ostreococcus tauri]CEF99974.1 unnamed product [Ostreococcus tauri]|eukprot:XP_022840136.1 unnamed product [Ostreococcus tauri]
MHTFHCDLIVVLHEATHSQRSSGPCYFRRLSLDYSYSIVNRLNTPMRASIDAFTRKALTTASIKTELEVKGAR